ncbi:polyprenyl synthetase family protein [Thermodesulfovibrionales bacterium]|nr:polyprenyl synthetase family protein [Thermodesulfovibrionales bacterium]
MDIKKYLEEKKWIIDSFLESYFSAPITPGKFRDCMVYSLTARGKRIRPILCLAAYEACGGKADDIVPYSSALEFIHTYSLIHDDLPAMDNDDLRRNKPTSHKVFGEGMAILAGDALLTEAFYVLSNNMPSTFRVPHSALLRVIREVAMAAGAHGMVGGQAQDLLSEGSEADAETLLFIHRHKTAAIITASVRTGGILANGSDDELQGFTRYGENVGLAFQVIDDILDVEGRTALIGKTVGADAKKRKMTYPRLYGIEKSREMAEELIHNAVESLSIFDKKAEPLREIAMYLLKRRS